MPQRKKTCNVIPCKLDDESFAFVSYDHEDSGAVFPVIEKVSAGGYAIWYDKGINISSTWSDEIALAIMRCKIFIVFISKNSVSSSYVRSEIEFALNNRTRIVPVYLDGQEILPPGLALGLNSTQGIMDASSSDGIAAQICEAIAYNNVPKQFEASAPAAGGAKPAQPARRPRFGYLIAAAVAAIAAASAFAGWRLASPRAARVEEPRPSEALSVDAGVLAGDLPLPGGHDASADSGTDVQGAERSSADELAEYWAAAAEENLASPGEKRGSVVVRTEQGVIDWARNVVEATGTSYAPKGVQGESAASLARRGAITDLQRNLAELLYAVQVDSRTTLSGFKAKGRVASEVNGIIRNVEVSDGAWDGESYTVTGRVGLPQLMAAISPDGPGTERPKSAGKPAAAGGGFTGLVIDARHLPVTPSLVFQVLDEAGREIYGLGTADPAFAARDGLAGYSEDLGLAMEDARVGDNPVVTRATRLSHGSGIVIPSIAASMVRDAPYDFVSECRVIIVCGQGAD
ncbi:MAG: TIR domain-containing protein [Synergistaceae bacterium]|jgi:hypothetical protein|nr:TIR domain-containing protein [Synergistaceae bacterium]